MGAIFGTGRSGTTWLGSIVDAHPRVLYRFEPIHALRGSKRIAALRELIRDPSTSEQESRRAIADLAEMLRKPDLRTERPPFFPKDGGRLRGRTFLNRAGRRVPIVPALYAMLYPSPPGAWLVFKEVSLEHELCALAKSGIVPIVYLIRHPAAYVASMKSGIAKGVMNDKRAEIALDLARDRAPAVYERYRGQADSLSLEQRLTIAWVADTNLALGTTLGRQSVLHLVYEDLCENTPQRAADVYEHFGLDMSEQSRAFVHQFATGENKEVGVNPYFSVFRDPRKAMNKWKSKLDQQTINSIREIYELSLAAKHFGRAWDWACAEKPDPVE